VQGMAAAAAAAAAAIAAKPAGQISINLGGGAAGSSQLRPNGSQGAAGTQSAGAQRSVYDFDIEGVEDKPWSKPGASRLRPRSMRSRSLRPSHPAPV